MSLWVSKLVPSEGGEEALTFERDRGMLASESVLEGECRRRRSNEEGEESSKEEGGGRPQWSKSVGGEKASASAVEMRVVAAIRCRNNNINTKQGAEDASGHD